MSDDVHRWELGIGGTLQRMNCLDVRVMSEMFTTNSKLV